MFEDQVSDAELLRILGADGTMGGENNAHYVSGSDSPVHAANEMSSAEIRVAVESHHMFRHQSEMCQLKGGYLNATVTGLSDIGTFVLELSAMPVCESAEKADCHPNLLILAKKKRARNQQNLSAAADISSANYRLFLVYHLDGLYVVDQSDFAGDVNAFLKRLTQSNALERNSLTFDPASGRWSLALGADGVMLTIIKPLRKRNGDKVTIDDVITRMANEGHSSLDVTQLKRALSTVSVQQVRLRVRQYAVAAGFPVVAEGVSPNAVRDKKSDALADIKISHVIGQRDRNGDLTFCATRTSTCLLVLHHKTDPNAIKAAIESEDGSAGLVAPSVEAVPHGVLVQLSLPPQNLGARPWLRCWLSLTKHDDASEPVQFLYLAHSGDACGCGGLSLGVREEQRLARASPRRGQAANGHDHAHGHGRAKRRTAAAPASPEDNGYVTSSSPPNNNIPESDDNSLDFDNLLSEVFSSYEGYPSANVQTREIDTDGALPPRQRYFPHGAAPLQTSFLAALEHDGPVFDDSLDEIVPKDSWRKIAFVFKLTLAFVVLPLVAVWLANK